MKKYIVLIALFMFQFIAKAQFQNEGYGPKEGFKVFAEFSGGAGLGIRGYNRVSLSTSLGYQFNPYIYAGAGALYDFNTKLPIAFVDVRGTLNKKLSPFLDLRGGLNLKESTLYMSPAFGCRFGLDNGSAICLGMAFDYTRTLYDEYYVYYDTLLKRQLKYLDKTLRTDNYAFCLRASYEF